MKQKSKKHIRAILFGAGQMGMLAVKYLHERGGEIVAVVDRQSNIGKDIGELAGIGTIGVPIHTSNDTDLSLLIQKTEANVALHCSGVLGEIADQVKICLQNGLDVLTLSEDAYYPHVTHPKLTKELNQLAIENGVSFVAVGMQDVTWSNEAVVLSGNCVSIESITCEHYGILDGVGDTEIIKIRPGILPEEFYEYQKQKDESEKRSPLTFALFEIADELGLHITDENTPGQEPIIAKQDFETPHGFTIHAGQTMGYVQSTELKTEEGITIIGKMVFTYAAEGAKGVNIWRFKGLPSFEVVTDDPAPFYGTIIDMIYRIPDVMNARPGFLTVKDLPKPRYRHGILSQYLND